MARRRLTARERQIVEPAVDRLMDELELNLAKIECMIVDSLVLLPAEVRTEALHLAMNEIGRQLFDGASVGAGVAG
jgi:hypothetical protein